MLCRRSQTISKRSTPQPSLGLIARDRGSACHMQSEWKIKTKTKREKTKATTKTKTMTSWVQACRLRPVARLCADCRPLSLGHGHGHGMDTRSRGVSSGLLSHFHSPYTVSRQVGSLCLSCAICYGIWIWKWKRIPSERDEDRETETDI